MEGGNVKHRKKSKGKWNWDIENTIASVSPRDVGKFAVFPVALVENVAETLLPM